MNIQIYTKRHTHIQMHTHTQLHTLTHAHKQSHTYTQLKTHKQSCKQNHTMNSQTNTHIQSIWELGCSEPLGGHIGGKGPLSPNI